MVTFNSLDLLKGKARPHYLVGDGIYEKIGEGKHKLTLKAYFPSERDSIGDRAKCHFPHVNMADAYFGLWNSIHVFMNYFDFAFPLAHKGEHLNLRPIPVDTEITLETKVDTFVNPNSNSKYDIKANYVAHYYHNGKMLMRFKGNSVAMSPEK